MCAFLSISVTGPLLELFTALCLDIYTSIYIYHDKSYNRAIRCNSEETYVFLSDQLRLDRPALPNASKIT